MSRELTRQEKAAIRSLVKRWCANYDKDIGCLPLVLQQLRGGTSGHSGQKPTKQAEVTE